jgi:hypothetical protein
VKYLFLVCVDPAITPEEAPGEIDGWIERAGSGRVIGNALRGPGSATTVRVRRRERLVTDGPFAETKEFVAGFDVIEAESLEEAIELAAAHPVAKFGSIEVRAFAADEDWME